MASIFKPKGARKYVIEYTDEFGQRRKKTGATDKVVTQRMAAKLENDIDLRRRGLLDPAAERRAAHERKPVREHLGDFRQSLIDKGDSEKHVELFVSRARRVLDAGKVTRLSQLTADRIQGALALLREERTPRLKKGRSLATCNHHRAAIRGFSRWLWTTGRLSEDPLVGVAGFNAQEDRRHDRRTLGVDELRKLIEAAEKGEPHRGMTGPARALCYRLAVATGLRFSEIESLRPESFNGASVTIKAAYAKNGQTATLPLPEDVAADMAAWVANVPAGSPVFPLPNRGADMLKLDLDAAGILYRDAAGLVFDFHSLRCQTATLADQAGVSPRTVQKLMRHSTLELTGRYTRPRAVELQDAARSLPALKPTAGQGATTPENCQASDDTTVNTADAKSA
jgi:integrase